MLNFLKKLFKRKPLVVTKDPMEAFIVAEAYKTGKIVIAHQDENGNLKVEYMNRIDDCHHEYKNESGPLVFFRDGLWWKKCKLCGYEMRNDCEYR